MPFDTAYELFNSVDDVVEHWVQIYKSTLKEFIPCKAVKVNVKDKPWITREFKRLIRKRNRLWRRFKRTGNPAHYQTYKKVRNKAVTLNRKIIIKYHEDLEIELCNSSNPKKWWRIVKA